MKKILLLLIGFNTFCFGQKIKRDLKKLEGVWIAEDYYNSFEKTKSAVKSKGDFYFGSPVGLRINTKEVKNEILNIGYSVLHDHLIYPEVSDYILQGNDTIREQGSFKLNLNQKDSLGYYKIIKTDYYDTKSISHLKWDVNKNSLTLYKLKGKGKKERSIRFTRVESGFDADNPFPNPIYHYTRLKTLVGKYIVKDSSGNILSNNFKIHKSGVASGFDKFENFTFYFSTDVYCGLPYKSDLIIINEDILNNNSKGFSFLINLKENGDIHLHKRKTDYKNEFVSLGDKVFELIKK
ncbi:hypothetical protein F7018_16025 [Tenacibaculum aiptasiae]|uniref:Uncharacterized protein n=1 Tax=Tenacibaculum aiptasiae TaxID=426481 RepID=A0A7J5A8T9_9FLAO|nr:hypothetical protein [Tenacibaculum aiptasiae]KAB1153991.1 hypothetical protein F7018_16025 [Tenacibaculum aiptasiae]